MISYGKDVIFRQANQTLKGVVLYLKVVGTSPRNMTINYAIADTFGCINTGTTLLTC